MAIQDRNLSVGTKLYARYKGETYTAEVVEKEEATLFRLSDGREFKSPSAAGTAITEKACNGWAFWSVGEPGESTGPVGREGHACAEARNQGAREEGTTRRAARDRGPGWRRGARRRAHGRRG